MSNSERFWAKVEKTDTCWLWRGQISRSKEQGSGGYGRFSCGGRNVSAHRYAYGPVPAGLVLDHLCRVRHCVNPAHMEPVTNTENVRRGISPTAINARKTRCYRGHALTNVYSYRGYRLCRQCRREDSRKQARKTEASLLRSAKQCTRAVHAPADHHAYNKGADGAWRRGTYSKKPRCPYIMQPGEPRRRPLNRGTGRQPTET